MNNVNKKRILIYIILFICSFSILTFRDKHNLKVSFFDIGQGDSSFIQVNGYNILIDGGPDNLVLRRLGESLTFFDRKIDLIIISHFHSDHISGLIEVIKRYHVGQVIYNMNSPSSPVFDALLQTIDDEHGNVLQINNIRNINLDDNCDLEVISPNIFSVPFNENNSVIAKLDCYQHTFLFSGDNEYKVEQAIIKKNLNLQVDIFKASHHGSNTSNKEYFLKFINPKSVIISAGKNNRFHHPNKEVLDRLESLGIKTYRTDKQGSIIFRYVQATEHN